MLSSFFIAENAKIYVIWGHMSYFTFPKTLSKDTGFSPDATNASCAYFASA